MTEQEIYRAALNKWGLPSQLEMLNEECAELIVAVSHFRRDRATATDVMLEMADVLIMIDQISLALSSAQHLALAKKIKLERLEERLEEKDERG